MQYLDKDTKHRVRAPLLWTVQDVTNGQPMLKRFTLVSFALVSDWQPTRHSLSASSTSFTKRLFFTRTSSTACSDRCDLRLGAQPTLHQQSQTASCIVAVIARSPWLRFV